MEANMYQEQICLKNIFASGKLQQTRNKCNAMSNILFKIRSIGFHKVNELHIFSL